MSHTSVLSLPKYFFGSKKTLGRMPRKPLPNAEIDFGCDDPRLMEYALGKLPPLEQGSIVRNVRKEKACSRYTVKITSHIAYKELPEYWRVYDDLVSRGVKPNSIQSMRHYYRNNVAYFTSKSFATCFDSMTVMKVQDYAVNNEELLDEFASISDMENITENGKGQCIHVSITQIASLEFAGRLSLFLKLNLGKIRYDDGRSPRLSNAYADSVMVFKNYMRRFKTIFLVWFFTSQGVEPDDKATSSHHGRTFIYERGIIEEILKHSFEPDSIL